MGGLTFSEVMSGPVALGASDPDQGAKSGDAAKLAIHCKIEIDDVDGFVADRDHTGTIEGSVEYEPWGELPVTRGIFNLFSPGDRPGEKFMAYRLAFERDGKPYFLAGRKHVHDDPGFDMWKDTTTLYTVVHEGADESGPAVAAGVLSLGVEELTKMMATMRPTHDGGVGSLEKFGKVFLGALWETYGADKIPGGAS